MITLNAMSIDVEDYFQVSAFASVIQPKDWPKHESRVEQNTQRILKLLDEHNYKSTFFVLGWVAERYPNLVREIADLGHEIACHGYSHQLIYKQTEQVFREETFKAKKILEDITQSEVNGYRAASYSITKSSLWALDILIEAGFKYDSSIFPIRHDRYGIPDAESVPHMLTAPNGKQILEFPLSKANWFGLSVPIAGGGYFRLLPYFVTKAGINKVTKNSGQPYIFYLHPWEVDPQQPRIEASWFSKFRHYRNLDQCETRLRKLMRDFKFTTVAEVLENLGLLDDSEPVTGQLSVNPAAC